MRFCFTTWRTQAGYAENSGSEMPSRTNLETQQQRDFSCVQREPWPGSTCCIFQQVSETPNGSFWVQDHLITLIPRLPSDLAARAGGRQALSARDRHGASGWRFQPAAVPVPPASLCPARTQRCPGLGSSTFSLTAFSPPSLSGECAANPISTV